MKNFFCNTNLFFIFLSRVGMVCIDNSGRIYYIHFFIHFMKSHQVFIVIVRNIVSMFASSTTEDDMRIWITRGFYFVATMYEVVRLLCSIYRVEHYREITTSRVFHAGCYVKSAYSKTMLLIFNGTSTDCNIC